MADEPNNQQTTTTEPPQGNSPEVRNPDGSLKDQTSIQQSGDQKTETSLDKSQSQTSDRSFLNREPEKKEEPKADDKGEVKSEAEGDKKPEPQTGAPEKYEDFKLPDGYQFDPETLKTAQATFKELGLTQEQGQKLVDLYAANGITAAEAPYKLWADTQTQWVDQIMSDFGESKANEMRTDINKGIEAAFPPKLQRAFREAIDLTGAGSNPAMFEAFHTLFKPFLEGTPVKGGAPTKESQTAPKQDARPTAAEAIYPHLVGNRSE